MTSEVRPGGGVAYPGSATAAAATGAPAVFVALSAEDAKLVTLARGAMGRAGGAQGAAVRDDDGRTYAAAAVSLPSLTLTAVQAAVVLAASSAASGLEAAVVIDSSTGGAVLDQPSLAVLREFGTSVLIVADAAGAVLQRRLL